MSRTLTLIDAGWESVQLLVERGQRANALDQLTRLLARPDVPAAILADGHRLAGELAVELGKYATARRHLKAAAALEPKHAGTRYAMGRAWEEDPDGCDRRAAICYKKATMLDAANPLYRVAFGRSAARCGKLKRGTSEMLAAVEAATNDLAVIRVAVSGLLEAGKIEEARHVIAKARFLNAGNSELAGLWERVKFESARLSQRKMTRPATTHTNTRYAQDAHFATDGDRVTLPFVRLVTDADSSSTSTKGTTGGAGGNGGGTVRRDTASFPRPHLTRLHARKADC